METHIFSPIYTHFFCGDINNYLFITARALMIAKSNQSTKIQLDEMSLLGILIAHV